RRWAMLSPKPLPAPVTMMDLFLTRMEKTFVNKRQRWTVGSANACCGERQVHEGPAKAAPLFDADQFTRWGETTKSGVRAQFRSGFMEAALISQSLCRQPKIATRRAVVQGLAAGVLLSTMSPAMAQLAVSTAINRVARF